jgi:hypothetical protein
MYIKTYDMKGVERMNNYMPTDMQYKDGLRKDKFLNDLIIKALKNNDIKTALEYLQQDNERIEKALEE